MTIRALTSKGRSYVAVPGGILLLDEGSYAAIAVRHILDICGDANASEVAALSIAQCISEKTNQQNTLSLLGSRLRPSCIERCIATVLSLAANTLSTKRSYLLQRHQEE